MAKFGRYEFGKAEPTETYEGGRMEIDKGYVRIYEEETKGLYSRDEGRLVAAIYLDKGQSVREIKPQVSDAPEKPRRRKS